MTKKLITSLFLTLVFFAGSQNAKDSLLKITAGKTIDTNVVKAYIALSKLEMQANPEESRKYLKKAIEIGEAKKLYKQAGDAYMNLAILSFSGGKLDEAST